MARFEGVGLARRAAAFDVRGPACKGFGAGDLRCGLKKGSIFSVNKKRAEVDRLAFEATGGAATAHSARSFEHHHLPPRKLQATCAFEPGDARSDDDDVVWAKKGRHQNASSIMGFAP